MRAFNLVEIELMRLFTKLLDAPEQAAHIIFHSAINAQAIREIIISLARLRLKQSDFEKIESLMNGPVKRAFTKRNRIVHGQWQLYLKMGPKVEGEPPRATEATWQRMYVPSDPSIYEQMYRKPPNMKIRAAHIFSISDIQKAAQDVADLGLRMRQIRDAIALQPYIPPQPVF